MGPGSTALMRWSKPSFLVTSRPDGRTRCRSGPPVEQDAPSVGAVTNTHDSAPGLAPAQLLQTCGQRDLVRGARALASAAVTLARMACNMKRWLRHPCSVASSAANSRRLAACVFVIAIRN
jgi:hypothetical protein